MTDLRKVLTDEDAAEIKAALLEGSTQSEIAQAFDVSPATIHRIAKGSAYAHVPWPEEPTQELGELDTPDSNEFEDTEEGDEEEYKSPFSILTQEEMNDPVGPSDPEKRLAWKKIRHGARYGMGTEAFKKPDLEIPAPTEALIDAAIAKHYGKGISQADLIAGIAEEVEKEEQRNLLTDLSVNTPARVVQEEKKEVSVESIPQLDWEVVKKTAPSHPAVILALEDHALRTCLCIAFNGLDPKRWETPEGEKRIFSVAKALGITLKYSKLTLGASHRKVGEPRGRVDNRKRKED